MKPKTLFDKIWDSHLVEKQDDGTCLIYIDRHLVHEVTSPQAFEGLRNTGRVVRKPSHTFAVADHNVPTSDRSNGIKNKESRIQVFEGVCISKKNAGLNSSFTVRKISYGEGIERILPLFSPQINKIEVVKVGSVRRSKLCYLRKRSGKSARIAEKNVATPINKELEKNNNTPPKQSNLNKVSDDNKGTNDIVNKANISADEKEKVDEKK